MDTKSSRIDDEVVSQTPEKGELTYEETPPIEPIKEGEPDIFPPPKPRTNFGSIMTTIIVFALLFIVGFWLSGIIRKYAGTFFRGEEKETSAPTPSPKEKGPTVFPETTEDKFGTWKTYQVLNGKTRIAYEEISFKLPPEVLSPICDGSSCASQGTYLPGGTRFTVALRGTGQVLPDYRGRVISDLKGIPFPVAETLLVGQNATEFSGTFVGTTVGGYVFSQMRGFMVPVTDTISLEINHFSPSGIISDFTEDDILFNEIIQTLVLPLGSLEKGGEMPATATPTTAPLLSSPSAAPIIEE